MKAWCCKGTERPSGHPTSAGMLARDSGAKLAGVRPAERCRLATNRRRRAPIPCRAGRASGGVGLDRTCSAWTTRRSSLGRANGKLGADKAHQRVSCNAVDEHGSFGRPNDINSEFNLLNANLMVAAGCQSISSYRGS
jgi:hypothetical protein